MEQEGDLFIPRTLQMFGRLTAEEGSMCACMCVYLAEAALLLSGLCSANVFVKKTKVRDLAIPPVTFNLNREPLLSFLVYVLHHISFTLSPVFVYRVFSAAIT